MTPNKFQHGGIEWIPHTPGEPMPCPPDTLVRVLEQWEKDAGEYYDDHSIAFNWEWGENKEYSIIGWHPIEEQPKMLCPYCKSGLLWSEDRGAHCDGCNDFDPDTDLSTKPSLARRVLDLLEAGDIEQAKHELRKELE